MGFLTSRSVDLAEAFKKEMEEYVPIEIATELKETRFTTNSENENIR